MRYVRKEVIGDATLYLGDCQPILDAWKEEGRVFDAVCTDPPYGIGHVMKGGTWALDSGYHDMQEWDKKAPQEALDIALSLTAKAIVWGGQHFPLPVSRRWLVWHKIGSAPKMADAELAWTTMDAPTRIKSMHAGNGACGKEKRQHPTQKPTRLMEWCIGFFPDSRVILDPFAGSGTTGVAAIRMGRRFIGIEREKKYFEIACERIGQAQRQGQLFGGEA